MEYFGFSSFSFFSFYVLAADNVKCHGNLPLFIFFYFLKISAHKQTHKPLIFDTLLFVAKYLPFQLF